MLKNHLILLTGVDNFYGQTRRPWVSMKVPRLVETARTLGFTVDTYVYHQLVNQAPEIKDSVILYSFSQKRNIRDYLKGLMHYLDDGSNLIIPSYDLLLCHEDKGYQELFKRKLGITSLQACYFSSRRDLDGYTFTFPAVVKQSMGSNGKRVFLVHDRTELEKVVKNFEEITFFDKVDLLRRKYLRHGKKFKDYPNFNARTDYYEYIEYVKNERNFIIQEYVPGLTFDYRVLVVCDHYYLTKRHTRENDFRASGTKKFDFDFEPEPSLLDFAKGIYEKLDTPLLSLDIGAIGDKYYLFEFQATHFGISTILRSKGYYARQNEEWKFNTATPEIEPVIMDGVIRYIRKKVN